LVVEFFFFFCLQEIQYSKKKLEIAGHNRKNDRDNLKNVDIFHPVTKSLTEKAKKSPTKKKNQKGKNTSQKENLGHFLVFKHLLNLVNAKK